MIPTLGLFCPLVKLVDSIAMRSSDIGQQQIIELVQRFDSSSSLTNCVPIYSRTQSRPHWHLVLRRDETIQGCWCARSFVIETIKKPYL
jgi:hypothetical protein